MLAGKGVRDLVVANLNNICNTMNIQSDAHTSYDRLSWGIEAQVNDGVVRIHIPLILALLI